MYAGASIDSKAPCHLYSSRLAGGERYVGASPEGLPFTSCLKFRRESTPPPSFPKFLIGNPCFFNTVDPSLKIAAVTNKGQ